jgi:hypothetical protein
MENSKQLSLGFPEGDVVTPTVDVEAEAFQYVVHAYNDLLRLSSSLSALGTDEGARLAFHVYSLASCCKNTARDISDEMGWVCGK